MAISQHAVPAEVEDCRRTIEALQIELEIIGREEAVGIDASARRASAADEQLAANEQRLGELEQRWQAERELVDRILAHSRAAAEGQRTGRRDRQQARAGGADAESRPQRAAGNAAAVTPEERRAATLSELAELQTQADRAARRDSADPAQRGRAGRRVGGRGLDRRSGRPHGEERDRSGAEAGRRRLNQRVIGQRHALEMIARRIQTSRAKLDNPNKPIGVFMLCGPSGVGKTETALALAEALYGGEQNVITINMSEFQEAHTVSTLKGSPPGYVGYGEGGVLTEAVRRRPYSVVLLDEVEKAHSDVHEIFFQVFDKGWMEDGEGRRIDFKNTIILLTSNVGTELIMNMCKDPELMPEPEGIAKALREPLLKVFPAALLGRLVVIPYYPLSDEMLGNIVRLQLGRIAKRVAEHHKIPFTYDDEAVKLIVSRCTEVESGGRMIDAILTNTVLPDISREFLDRTMEGRPLNGLRLEVTRRRLCLLRSSEHDGMAAETRQPPREVSLEEAIAIAILFQKNGQLAEAEEVYCKILAVEPDHPDALHFRRRPRASAGAQRRRHRADRAEPAARARPRRLLQQPRHHLQGAGAGRRGGRRLQRAMALNPDHANALQQPRRAVASAGQAREAEAAYRKAIELDPEHIDAYHNLGVLLAASGGRRRPSSATAR